MRTLVPALSALPLLLAPLRSQEIPEKLDPQQSCTTNCHQGVVDREFLHDPVKQDDCSMCHIQADETLHDFDEIADVQASCLACHEIELEGVVHAPMTDGECTYCHDPHGGQTKFLSLAKDEATLCRTCHSEIADKMTAAFVHGPFASGACSDCHAAHSAPHANLLTVEPLELCFKCHEEAADRFYEADNQHAPIMIGCGPCHDPHGSEHRFYLASDIRTQCTGCHQELGDQMTAVGAWHGALDTERSCLTCHQAHVSEHDRLLTKGVQAGCADCHSEPVPRTDGRRIEAVSLEVETAEVVHGPIQDGDCVACHQPHVSAHPALLLKEYPDGFYAKYEAGTYALCFECHDRAAFEQESTTDATGFRDGDRNLHYLHVNKMKGRSCGACHELHAGTSSKLIAQDVPFGKWMLRVGFEPLANGGSCAPGCHTPAQYDRQKPPDRPQEGR